METMNYHQLDKIIEEHINQVHVPAAALAVVNEQEILYARGYGLIPNRFPYGRINGNRKGKEMRYGSSYHTSSLAPVG